MDYTNIFTQAWLTTQFPPTKTEDFFEALFGGAEEGAYDIHLLFIKGNNTHLEFAFELVERPGKCLVCNLTYGLPQVFSRHPVINAKGITQAAATAVGRDPATATFALQTTQEVSASTHTVPFIIQL